MRLRLYRFLCRRGIHNWGPPNRWTCRYCLKWRGPREAVVEEASIRRCPECERFDDYLMEDGSWICHSCGHVEFSAEPARHGAA